MDFRLLGSLDVRSNGQSIALGPPKERAVLAILLLHPGEIVPSDRLIELLWGERPPRTAGHSIQIYVSELRKALEQDGARPVIVTRPPGYLLDVDADAIDVHRFERLVADGRRLLADGDATGAQARLREAIALWRGSPLADFEYEELAQAEIRRLDELHGDALEQLATAELALGDEEAARAAADAALAGDPLRERAIELRVLALCRAGRQPEALRAYQQFRTLLADELGVEPSPSLQQLHERVLLRDPLLGLPAARSDAGAATPVRNPYKGLRPFGEADAADFFGRDGLVRELVARLAGGSRLLALVGPSGCGKSSVIDAGLLPALRSGAVAGSGRWRTARMMPGRHPVHEWAETLREAAPGTPVVVVVDQLEELFAFNDEPVTRQFLGAVTAAVADPERDVRVVLALRADFYDRPLLDPAFAATFIASVVNMIPMTAEGLEAAVLEPARRVGVEVEPALLARLVAETIYEPGALPLLQYTLTELFDQRAGGALTMDGYRALGGLEGAVSRRAEQVFADLAEDRREVALQVFLRLVRLSDGDRLSRRRVPLGELAALDLDPVALSEVLDGFGRSRLLAFDRDPAGGATVEVAHESLLWEWRRLADWVEHHRVDLRQHQALAAAADEWEAAGRDPDYLLGGGRLAGYEDWSRAAGLRLTEREHAFLEAGIARRRAREAEDAARREQERRLERRARARLWTTLGAVALLTAGVAFALLSWLGSRPADVALLFEGTGDIQFGDMAAAGFDRAVSEFGLRATARTVTSGTREVEDELHRLSDAGVDVVFVGIGANATLPTMAVAEGHPGTRYVAWENDVEPLPPNVTNLVFRSEEGAYLAGAAAALRSRTGIIGSIGFFPVPPVDAYLAGYAAGATAAKADITVLPPVYLSDQSDRSSFGSRPLGAQAAEQLYGQNADVILAVGSSLGVFEAAHAQSEAQGRQLWAIGVDTDEFVTVASRDLPVGITPADWQEHILTSVMKHLDTAFYATLADYARGQLAAGTRSFGLAEGGIEIAWSGGFLEDNRTKLEDMQARIIRGEIHVPAVP